MRLRMGAAGDAVVTRRGNRNAYTFLSVGPFVRCRKQHGSAGSQRNDTGRSYLVAGRSENGNIFPKLPETGSEAMDKDQRETLTLGLKAPTETQTMIRKSLVRKLHKTHS